MEQYMQWAAIATLLVAAGFVGAYLHAVRLRKAELAKRRIPRQWPLIARALVNSREQLAWHWLMRCFYDHHVLVKLPVTRFTMPQIQKDSQHWFSILTGLYCTFTICTTEGKVIACVDVPGPRGLSLSNQALKHSLLSQCKIPYCVVDPQHLPSIIDMRTVVLGEQAVIREEIDRLRTESRFNQTRDHLKAVISRQRHAHPIDLSNLTPAPNDTSMAQDSDDSHSSSGWRQHDSFIAPLDSRAGELR